MVSVSAEAFMISNKSFFVDMCVLTCLCVSAVDAGSVAGAERSGGTRLSDPGAQPARAAEQGRSG